MDESIRETYRSSCFHLIFRVLDHVVAEETKSEVVIRPNDAGEGGYDCYAEEEVLNLSLIHI